MKVASRLHPSTFKLVARTGAPGRRFSVAVPVAIPFNEIVLLRTQSLGVGPGAADIRESAQSSGCLHPPLLRNAALHDRGVFLKPVRL